MSRISQTGVYDAGAENWLEGLQVTFHRLCLLLSCILCVSSNLTWLRHSMDSFDVYITSGSIYIDEKIVDDSKKREGVSKRNIGVIFQDLALFPHLTVR